MWIVEALSQPLWLGLNIVHYTYPWSSSTASRTATLEFWHKKCLLRLETKQTFDKSDKKTKNKKNRKSKRQKYKMTEIQKDKKDQKESLTLQCQGIFALLQWLLDQLGKHKWHRLMGLGRGAGFTPSVYSLLPFRWWLSQY